MAKTVLIADDSDASRDSLSFALKQKGYAVVQVKDGQEALDILAKQPAIDLMITDINMPKVNGLELVRKTRAMNQYRFTPIIVLSSEDDVIKQSTEAGASAWIAKSSKMGDQLWDTIKKLVP